MPKLMIVDDDRVTVELLKTLLEMDGFDVMTSPNIDQAYEAAHAVFPDAFLVDFHLAGLHGTDFVRALRNQPHFEQTPIIMTSGLNYEDEAMAAGATQFLIKPFDPNELVETLKTLLG